MSDDESIENGMNGEDGEEGKVGGRNGGALFCPAPTLDVFRSGRICLPDVDVICVDFL